MYREIDNEEIKIDKTLGYSYFIDKGHPLASKDVGRVYYHRHIASLSLGRWLLPTEVVHHKDRIKTNNASNNLVVLSEAEHTLLHNQEDGNEKVLVKCPVCSNNFLISKKSVSRRVTCSEKCARKKAEVWNISKEELEILIWNKSYRDISTIYPISDVGAKKKAKALGCRMPPPYFFNKTDKYRQVERSLNNIPDLST